MTGRELKSAAATAVLSELETLSPGHVWVPVRANKQQVSSFERWLETFEFKTTLLWCNGPDIMNLMSAHGLSNGFGKGRDVWLALGPAAEKHDYIAIHDADTKNFSANRISSLIAPLDYGFSFTKGYYARIEQGTMYGRLCRLLFDPLVDTIAETYTDPFVEYLASFRYGLAGEMGMTSDFARQIKPPYSWGLEIGILDDAFDAVGFDGTAQVDLGRHEHEHRSVDGEDGLQDMSQVVVGTLYSALRSHGLEIDLDLISNEYTNTAERYIRQYRADATINGLSYSVEDELRQVEAYTSSVRNPDILYRLPSWTEAPIDPAEVTSAGAIQSHR